MTIPATTPVHMDDVASQPAAIAYLQRTWVPGSHASVHAIRVKGRWIWQVQTWPNTPAPAQPAPEQPKELAA